jgi:hypothetical protein
MWDEEHSTLDCLLGKRPKTIEEKYQEQKQIAEYYQQIAHTSNSYTGDYSEF